MADIDKIINMIYAMHTSIMFMDNTSHTTEEEASTLIELLKVKDDIRLGLIEFNKLQKDFNLRTADILGLEIPNHFKGE